MKRQKKPNKRLLSELFVLNMLTKNIVKVPFKDMVSHYCFINDNTIFAYANNMEGIDGFYTYNLDVNELVSVKSITNNRDGHPSAASNGKVVFDTYPDKSRHQNLYLWGGVLEKATLIARLYAPIKFKDEARVDLHPRFRADAKFISFDTSYSGQRCLATMKVI